MVYLITGKAKAGKTTIGKWIANALKAEGRQVVMIDGDEFREKTKNKDFSDAGRIKNLRNAAKLAAELERENKTVICAFVAPRQEWRDMMCTYWTESKVIYVSGGMLWPGTTYDPPVL